MGRGVFSSTTSLLSPLVGEGKKKATAAVAHVVGRTEQKAGSCSASKSHKHHGLTGFLVCSFLPPPPFSIEWWGMGVSLCCYFGFLLLPMSLKYYVK